MQRGTANESFVLTVAHELNHARSPHVCQAMEGFLGALYVAQVLHMHV